MKIGHQINWINESSSHCLGFHFGLQLGKSINWWPKKMVSLQNLQTFDHFTLTLVVAEKRLNTDIKRVGHRRNLETHSSERYRGSEPVARSHCDSLDLHPRNGFQKVSCTVVPNFASYLRKPYRGHSYAFMSLWYAFIRPLKTTGIQPPKKYSNGIISSCSSTWLGIAVTDLIYQVQ